MGRHYKKGLDYFNLDCNQEDNLTLVEAKHEIAGYGVVIKLWKKIYQINGYYCDWDEKNQLLFAKDINIKMDFLKEVLETCFDEGIFHRGLYEKYKILTSSGTQKRWKAIVVAAKRKDCEIDPKHLISSFIQEEIAKTTEEIIKTHEETPQSKVKESKVNKSKEKEEGGDGLAPIFPLSSFKVISENEFYKAISAFTGFYQPPMLREFYEYWRERSPSGKMRFQLEKTWELELRLKKWQRNAENFKNGTNRKSDTGKLGISAARTEALRNW